MSDDMDLCGAIWSHEMNMRRLLSLLRQSQTTCSDTECFAPATPNNAGNDGFMMMTLAWMVVAFLLYMMRPSSIRNRENDLKPPRGADGNGDGGSPPSTPTI